AAGSLGHVVRRLVARHDSPRGSLRSLGRYHIVRTLGVGGTSTVYEARQDQPARVVALKLLRQSLATPALRRRFRCESRILAQLLHPGIAQVYATGTWVEGGLSTPFFVMEFVPAARTITRYADGEGLDVAARLELFAQVCDAV